MTAEGLQILGICIMIPALIVLALCAWCDYGADDN